MVMKKRVLTIFMAMLMVFAMMPAMARTAHAAEGTPAIQLVIDGVAENIIGAQKSSVWYGNYMQSSDGAGGFNIEPIKWRVLQNADKNLLLFADQVLDCRKYREKETRTRWYFSDLRSWLNGLDNYWTGLENDYTDDNFKDEAFTAKELAAIADTHVVTPENPDYEIDGGPDSTDKLFILSCQEALTPAYGFSDAFPYRDEIGTRIMTATDYAKSLGVEVHTSTDPRYDGKTSWWLRTYCDTFVNPVTTGVDYRGRVWTDGIGPVISTDIGVVPAFNLDLESVLFTSAATGGKSSGTAGADALRAVSATSTSEWKMTLKDADRNFSVSNCQISNNSVSVDYTGAKTGDNEYISAVITDSNGNITYYGRIKNCTADNDGSGTVTINTENKFSAEEDTLYVFNEQYNGDKKTDYASELQLVSEEIKPAVKAHALLLSGEIGVKFRVAFPEDFETSSFRIDFLAADGRKSSVAYDESTLIDDSSDRYFIFNINALELADNITATLHYGNDKTITDTYSAMTYIQYVQKNWSEQETLLNLVNTLQAYGYYMQASGWTDNRTHSPIPEPATTLTDSYIETAKSNVSEYVKTEDLEDSGISASNFSLTLNAQTVINISVKLEEGVKIISTGYQEITKDDVTWYQFSTPQIGPKNLGKDYTVTVETTQGIATVKASAMAYVNAILGSEAFTKEQKLAMAAYYYYYAAAYRY